MGLKTLLALEIGNDNRSLSSRHSRTSQLTALDGQGECILTTPSALVTPRTPRDPASSVEEARRDRPFSSGGPPGRSISTFTFPNRILFGSGARDLLASELSRLGVARPLVVTDPGVVAIGLVGQVIAPLGKSALVYGDVQANPAEEDVLAGLTLYRESQCDGIIGLGGGSSIDAAKAIRLLVTHPGRLADYDLTRGGQDRIGPDLPAMVAIPTTAGTGSEAGRGALIQLPQTGRKTIVLSRPSTADRRDLRSGIDERPAAGINRRDGDGCVHPLRGKLPFDHLPPDL